MDSDVREYIKIGLLAVIAVTLAFSTFTGNEDSGKANSSQAYNQAPAQANQPPQIASDFNPNDFNTPPAQPAAPAGPPTKMAFGEMAHSFGKINQDSENKHVFKFTNSGDKPLIISNAVGSCGCTVPEYPKEPIPPGETGEIKVVYKPGKQKGSQTKTVTITANTEPATTKLEISAEVEEVAGATGVAAPAGI